MGGKVVFHTKYFVLGIICSIIITGISIYASGNQENIEVIHNSVKIFANDKEVNMDNFLFQDKNYIPLRAVSEELGQVVYWNEDKNSANISTRQKNTLVEVDCVLLGIKLGMTIDEVIALKGEPIEITEETSAFPFPTLRYQYSGYEVLCDTENRNVKEIVIRGNNLATNCDVKIGDDIGWVLSQYGFTGITADQTSASYFDRGSYKNLYFIFDENKKVIEIALLIVPV